MPTMQWPEVGAVLILAFTLHMLMFEVCSPSLFQVRLGGVNNQDAAEYCRRKSSLTWNDTRLSTSAWIRHLLTLGELGQKDGWAGLQVCAAPGLPECCWHLGGSLMVRAQEPEGPPAMEQGRPAQKQHPSRQSQPSHMHLKQIHAPVGVALPPATVPPLSRSSCG